MIDLHTHSRYGQHGKGELRDLVTQAERLGLRYLGISEHFPLPRGFVDPAGDSAMRWEDLPAYLQELGEVSKNPRVCVVRSAEVDFIPECLAQIIAAVSALDDVDYLIGSVHFIDGWGFDFSKEVFNQGLLRYGTADAVYKKYYSLVREMTGTGLFDVVGHLDLPKKFGHYPAGNVGLDETLDCIADKELVLEINTAGNHKPVHEQYPSKAILEKAFKRGIPITAGSDAHEPSHVGRDISLALRLAHSIGYKTIVAFKGKKGIEIPLTQI